MAISQWHGTWPISNSGPSNVPSPKTFARPDISFVSGIKVIRLSLSTQRGQDPDFTQASFQGEIVKRTFSAIMLLGLAVAVFQGASANAQSTTASIFQVVPTPNENHFLNNLFAASASSPNDIWAVGHSTIHFDGTEWSVIPAPLINGDINNDLLGIVDISPTLAWAVGNTAQGTNPPQQVIEQWNGTKWSIFPGPKFPPDSQAILQAITSTSANDIWAVGNFGINERGFELFEHFNGTAWTAKVVPQTNGQEPLSVSADAPNDAWAVGQQGGDPIKTFATHWNGENWTGAKTPSVGTGNGHLNAVLALAPNNVWAVGLSTPTGEQQSATLTLIEHFDGTSWSVVPSPNVGPNSDFQSNQLLGLTANSPDDIWAFGSFLSTDGLQTLTLVLHWDGTSWTIVSSPDPTKGKSLDDLLFAGVVPSPGNVWIFGSEEEGLGVGFGTLAIHTTTGADSNF
jgi:hypothetical protein